MDGFCQHNFAPSRHNQLFIDILTFGNIHVLQFFVLQTKGGIGILGLPFFPQRSGETTKLQPLSPVGHFMQFVVDKACFTREICSLVV